MALPMTPKKTATSSSSTNSRNLAGIRAILRQNHLLIEDDEAFERYPNVGHAASDILSRDRNSRMSPSSHETVRSVRKSYATANELTFLAELWAVLLQKTRELQQLDARQKIAWVQKAWKQDFCRTNWSADFVHDSIPPIMATTVVQQKLLDSLPRVKNPKPDLAYGLQESAFTEEEQHINGIFGKWSMLSPEAYHCFFAVEMKCANGTIEDAENQCCRAGAAMVHARMKFNEQESQNRHCNQKTQPAAMPSNTEAGQPKLTPTRKTCADLESIAFSLALIPSKAHMFIHWAEISPTAPIVYHMNLVNSYDFRAMTGSPFADLRHDIDNVLDWGILKRKQEISRVCKEIAAAMEDKAAMDFGRPQSHDPARKRKRDEPTNTGPERDLE